MIIAMISQSQLYLLKMGFHPEKQNCNTAETVHTSTSGSQFQMLIQMQDSLMSYRVYTILTSQRTSFCRASEPSSCTVSVKNSCFSTPGGTFLFRGTRFPQTSSTSWQTLRCRDPDYGILPCYSEPK